MRCLRYVESCVLGKLMQQNLACGDVQLRDEAARAKQQFGQFDGDKDAAARAAEAARQREAQVAQLSQCGPTTRL